VSEDRAEPLYKRVERDPLSSLGSSPVTGALPNPFLPSITVPVEGLSSASASGSPGPADRSPSAGGSSGTWAPSSPSSVALARGARSPDGFMLPPAAPLVLSHSGSGSHSGSFPHRPSLLSAAVVMASSPEHEELGSPTPADDDMSPVTDSPGATNNANDADDAGASAMQAEPAS